MPPLRGFVQWCVLFATNIPARWAFGNTVKCYAV
jgi:hypothetical protein